MASHNLDVQMVADMLDKDNCPASMGAFTYPDGSDGLLLVMVQPKHHAKVDAFLKQLYAEEGYESPQYPKGEPAEKPPVYTYEVDKAVLDFVSAHGNVYNAAGDPTPTYSLPAWFRFKLKVK